MVHNKFYKNHIEQVTERNAWSGGQSDKNYLRIYACYIYAINHSPFGTARGSPFATAVHLSRFCDPCCCRTVLKVLQCCCHHRRVHRCRRHRHPRQAIKSFSDALLLNSWSRANLKKPLPIHWHLASSNFIYWCLRKMLWQCTFISCVQLFNLPGGLEFNYSTRQFIRRCY